MKRICYSIAALLFFLFFLKACVLPWTNITFIPAYGYLKSQWKSDSVRHFPSDLPHDANIEQMFHCPGTLQAASILQIRVIFESQASYDKEILRLEAIVPTPSTAQHIEDYPAPHFIIPSNDIELFPLHLKTKHHWNHGQSRGYGVSTQQREIYYWVTSW